MPGNYDEEKNEELKTTEEPTKNDKMPGKLNVLTKIKISGKFIDVYCSLASLVLMFLLNAICYAWVVSKE